MDSQRQAESTHLAHHAWYIVMHGNDMALRVRNRMVLGEDSEGNLCYDSDDSGRRLVTLEFDEEGALWVRSLTHTHSWADRPEPARQVEPGTRLRLPHNVVQLNDRLDSTSRPGRELWLVEDPPAAARPAGGVGTGEADRTSGTADGLGEPVAEAHGLRNPPRSATARLTRATGAEDEDDVDHVDDEHDDRIPTLTPVAADSHPHPWPDRIAVAAVRRHTVARRERSHPFLWVAFTGAVALLASMPFLPGMVSQPVPPQVTAQPTLDVPARPAAAPPNAASDGAQREAYVQTLVGMIETTPASDAATFEFIEVQFRTMLSQDPGDIRALAGLRAVAEKRASAMAPVPEPIAQAAPQQPAAQTNAPDDSEAIESLSAAATTPETNPDGGTNAAMTRARELIELGHITAPPDDNAVAVLLDALGRHPHDRQAQKMLSECADRLVGVAVEAHASGLRYDARNLVEEVLAFSPNHPDANAFWRAWTNEPSPTMMPAVDER